MKKRNKSLVLIFNYDKVVSDGVLPILENSGLDFQYDAIRNRWAIYIRDNSKPTPDLLNFFSYIIGAENRLKGEDYLDMYIEVNEPPEGEYYETLTKIYKNVKFSEVVSGTYSLQKLIFERDII
jgi:hypothetical protein